jgi:hypothetical protein
MAFGTKALQVFTPARSNGGDFADNKEVFFPSKSGANGAPNEYFFRIFPDEQVYTAKEWKGEVSLGKGNTSFRSCLIGYDNPWDNKAREIKAAVDAELDTDMEWEEKSKAYKSAGVVWQKQSFFLNVLNRGNNKIQVLKGGYTSPRKDKMGNIQWNDKSTFGKLMLVKYRIPDPSNKKRPLVLEPDEIDTVLTCSGAGQFGKTYAFTAGSDNDPLSDDLLSLPRYDLETWVTGNGIWPNEALVRLVAGESYYDLVNEYKIALYPVLREAAVAAASVEEDEVGLFED